MPVATRSSSAGWRNVRANRCEDDIKAARATGRRWSAPAGPQPTATSRPGTRALLAAAAVEALAARGWAHAVARVPGAVPRVDVHVGPLDLLLHEGLQRVGAGEAERVGVRVRLDEQVAVAVGHLA